MKIGNILKKEDTIYISSVKNKDELLHKLVDKIIESHQADNFTEELKKQFLTGVLEREQKSSTGLGDGIAFPHGRINGLNKPIIALGIIPDGIDFDAHDGQLVKLVFLFLFPGNRHELGVKLQAVFARFLMQNNCFKKILELDDCEAIHKLIMDADLAIDTPITAQDLMCNVTMKLNDNMILQDATALMDEFNTEVAAVVDKENNLIGELDCIHLFQLELPDYIKKLHSVPPIHDFNPFSGYFADDAMMRVSSVLNTDIGRVQLNASLFEIIFLLSVKKYSIVHVCDGEKLVGKIDRITVLNKVFNL
jgi:mannitol/fructose-specific phosphotransferase system IIA component (Ntr-type)